MSSRHRMSVWRFLSAEMRQPVYGIDIGRTEIGAREAVAVEGVHADLGGIKKHQGE